MKAMSGFDIPPYVRLVVEKSLERLYAMSPQALSLPADRNPGVILGGRLILTEETRSQLQQEGALARWYRDRSKEAHPDKGGPSDEKRMKMINFANEVLGDPLKFKDWKTGKLYYSFES